MKLLVLNAMLFAYMFADTSASQPGPQECPGERGYEKCSAHCVGTCENPDGHFKCDKSCRHPGCKCPDETPIYFGFNQCGTLEDCKACEGQQVWNDKASACDKTCDDPEPPCTMNFVARCECPSSAPILANPDDDPNVYPECITIDRCPQQQDKQQQLKELLRRLLDINK